VSTRTRDTSASGVAGGGSSRGERPTHAGSPRTNASSPERPSAGSLRPSEEARSLHQGAERPLWRALLMAREAPGGPGRGQRPRAKKAQRSFTGHAAQTGPFVLHISLPWVRRSWKARIRASTVSASSGPAAFWADL